MKCKQIKCATEDNFMIANFYYKLPTHGHIDWSNKGNWEKVYMDYSPYRTMRLTTEELEEFFIKYEIKK